MDFCDNQETQPKCETDLPLAGGSGEMLLAGVGIGEIVSGLAIGLLASLVWLLILFAIKPRIKLDLEYRNRNSGPSGGWAFVVINSSKVSAVQVQARLWKLQKVSSDYPTRDRIDLKHEELFQLNGTWRSDHPKMRPLEESRPVQTGHNRFRFLTSTHADVISSLEADECLLFQVWAQHSFTNFGRVSVFRIWKAHPSDGVGREFLIESYPRWWGSLRTE
jgi:hypothetical protein